MSANGRFAFFGGDFIFPIIGSLGQLSTFHFYISITFFQVHLSFLYVGHTHEDIDAAFSRIAERLRKSEAETLPELLNIVPHAEEITGGMFNITGWMAPFIVDIRKHTKPLHYKFIKVGNKTSILYKGNQDSKWKELPNSLFNKTGSGVTTLPTGAPKLLTPNFEKINFDRMETASRQWACLFKDQKNNSGLKWWETWLKHLKRVSSSNTALKAYQQRNSKWLLPELPRQDSSTTPQNASDEPIIPARLSEMLQEETAEPEVHLSIIL